MVDHSLQFSEHPLKGVHINYLPYADGGSFFSLPLPRRSRLPMLALLGCTGLFSAAVSFLVLYLGFRESSHQAPILSVTSPPSSLASETKHSEDKMKKLEQAIAELNGLVTATVSPSTSNQEDDLRTVRVVFPKVFLRTGPSKASPALMAVSKDTRLVILLKHEGWIKVYAPSGEEAWVSEQVVKEEALETSQSTPSGFDLR